MASDPIMIGTLRLVPNRELARGRDAIALGQKALDLLSMLVAADGALVTKDELMAGVWPGVIVEENAIQVHIAALRKAMGAEGAHIRTVRGLGYRLDHTAANGLETAADLRPLIAVLPFGAVSDEDNVRSFADGVSEELLYAVGRIDRVRVIASASSFQFRGPDKDIGRVAAEIKASHVIDGTVRRTDGTVRVGVQLVETRDKTLVWSERFETSLDALAALHDTIAAKLATALKVEFVARERPFTTDGEAFDLYLRGRRLAVYMFTRPQGIAMLETAVTRDPELAPAWSALALARAIAARWDARETPFAKQAERVRHAAERAQALDANSGIAHYALALLEPFAHFRAVEVRLNDALVRTPGDADMLLQRSILAYTLGQNRTAFRHAARAREIDPLNPSTTRFYASLLAEMGLIDESHDAYMLAFERRPEQWAYLAEPWMRAAMRDDWKNVEAFEAMASGSEAKELTLPRLITAAVRDPHGPMRAMVEATCKTQLAENGAVDPSSLTLVCKMGFSDMAFNWVERSDYSYLFAADGRAPDSSGFTLGVLCGSSNTIMRSDRRFLRLCKKLGLTAYWLQTGNWPDCADDPSLSYDFRAEASL